MVVVKNNITAQLAKIKNELISMEKQQYIILNTPNRLMRTGHVQTLSSRAHLLNIFSAHASHKENNNNHQLPDAPALHLPNGSSSLNNLTSNIFMVIVHIPFIQKQNLH